MKMKGSKTAENKKGMSSTLSVLVELIGWSRIPYCQQMGATFLIYHSLIALLPLVLGPKTQP